MIRTFTITIGKVYNGTEECKNPHVELAGKQHIAVNCIDPAGCKYSVQLGPNDIEPCLTFLVRCSDCDTCGTKVIKKCFCDSVDDCGSCEICDTDGFCAPTCPHGICKDGICYECDEEVNCTCNKVCKNGECGCPPGTTLNDQGCCDECYKDGDCDVCDTCTDHGAYNSCEPKECNCDATGKCGTKGACVECTNSGQCPTNEVCDSHCGCKCAPGYKRINGICTPTDCPNGDEDCGVCEICVGTHCIPNQCPAGKVPVEVNGVCSCVEECNCDQPNCSSRFNFCGESAIPGKCGCQPCTGNCDTGCDDPCICDEHLNKCKFNPCFGSCESGLDCGPTCGCKDGECVPCDVLECTSDECARTLGCTCSAIGKCVKDACDSSPCSVAADCSLGCTCDGGVCNACSNFSCNTSDCSDHDGCVCSGGECVGDANPGCKDSITLTKDDGACTITGTLVKEKCCQCPAITLDVKTVSAVDKGKTAKLVKYVVEVRKGAYDGVSVESNPKVDEFLKPNIAENEPPTAGTIRLNYSISYKVFDIVNGIKTPTGLSTVSNQPAQQVTYVGSVSQKYFNELELPNILSGKTVGTQYLEVEFIELVFSLETKMVFPNTCEYASGTEIGRIKITSNDDFVKTPIGTTIKSDSCRLPFIKWTKFPLGSTNGNTFRKLYLPATEGNTYIDTIDGPKGAESCFTYLFEPDCSCDDPAQQYIVFCNPVFNKPVLEDCGKKAKINIDAACTANQVKDYELYVNGVVVKTFKLSSPQVFDWISIAPITSIKLHMKCDSIGQCDTEYTYPENKIEPIPQGSCKADGSVTFTFDDASYPGGISSITFDGVLKTSNFVFDGKLPNTNYTYQVIFSNGCVSSVKTTNWTCCVTPTIECSTGGKLKVITGSATGVKYNGVALPSTGIITPPATGTSPLTYVCDGVTKTISVVPYADYKPCCNIVLSTYTVDATAKTITLAIGTTSTSGSYTVAVKRTTGAILSSATMSNNAVAHIFTVTSDSDESLIVEIKNADTFCIKTIPVSFNANGCDLGLILSIDDDSCVLNATTDEKTCFCDTGKISGTVSSVTALPNNKLSATFAIAPVIANSAGKKITSSSLQIYVNGVPLSTETLYTLSPTPIVRTIDAYCTNNHEVQAFTASKEICQGSSCGGETHLLIVNIPNPYVVTGIIMGTTTTNPPVLVDSNGTWWIKYTPTGGNSIIISFKNITTDSIYTSGAINPIMLDSLPYTINVGTSDCYLCGGTVKGADIKLVYGVTLEDGCIYTGELSKRICVGSTSTLGEVALINSNPAAKKMQFDLYKGTTLLTTDFKKSPSSIDYDSMVIDFKPGQQYNVKASCNCEETASTSECFKTKITKYEPTGYIWGSNCNKKYGVTINSCYPGETIDISLAGVSKSITLDLNGTANVLFDLLSPLTSANVTILGSYTIGTTSGLCAFSSTIANDYVPAHTVSYNCTNGTNQEYTATISITGGGAVLITGKPDGLEYGTISGSSLTGITTTNHFSVTISINGLCSYSIPIYADCSCNVKTATVASPTLNVCVFNNVAPSSQTVSLTGVTQVNSDLPWWTVINSTTIGGARTGFSANISITGAQLLTLAPKSGTNNVNLYVRDTESGNSCRTIPLTINRTNVQYTTAPTCSSNGLTWGVEVTSNTPTITLSNVSAGSLTGGSSINGLSSTLNSFVKFTVNKGSCQSDLITVNIPTACAPHCSNSDIEISAVQDIAPCSLSGTLGRIKVTASTSNTSCQISSVSGGINQTVSTYTSGGFYYIGYPIGTSGPQTITVTDTCGCSLSTSVTLVQNCCSTANSVSIITTAEYCSTGDVVEITIGNPYGYTINNWQHSVGTWTTGPTSSGGKITIGSGTTQLNVSADIVDAQGNYCTTIRSSILATNCDVDLCASYTPAPCNSCLNGHDVTNLSLKGTQGPCATGHSCCGTPVASCVADCVASSSPLSFACEYYSTTCNGTCEAVSTLVPCVISVSDHVTMNSFTCETGPQCISLGSYTITKSPSCSFRTDWFHGGNTYTKFGVGTSCSAMSEIDAFRIYDYNIAGDTMTIYIELKNTGAGQCGNTYDISLPVFLNTTAYCCYVSKVTFPECSVCDGCN